MPPPPSLLESTQRALLHRISAGQAEGRAPSLVGAVVRDGSIAFVAGRGEVDGNEPDQNTQYRIGSITKTFVAIMVMRLRDEGRLDLLDRLDSFLPETANLPGVGSARIGELLAHTSGLASETPPPWWERVHGSVRPELADLFTDDGRRHPAGRHFHYSNPGFALLGALVARLRQTTWFDAVSQEILIPLGMSRTTTMPQAPHASGWAVHPWADLVHSEPTPDAVLMAPAGQLWSTASDLAAFAALLLGGSPAVLSSSTLAEMRMPAAPPTSTNGTPGWDSGFGLGLQLGRVDGRSLAGHGGSMPGFLASLWTSPAEGLAGICLANATSGPAVGLIAAGLIALTAQHEPALATPWRPIAAGNEPAAELIDLLGPWYWGANPFALRLRSDGDLELIALAGGGRVSRFESRPDGTWRGRDGYYHGEILSPVLDDSASTHLDIGSFVFTRTPYPAASGNAVVPGEVEGSVWQGHS
ncbi:MAG: beta-lactamase [Pseudonocardiales bacterium]|nr:beta-lactamase [Pseudonocardiales bacterium]